MAAPHLHGLSSADHIARSEIRGCLSQTAVLFSCWAPVTLSKKRLALWGKSSLQRVQNIREACLLLLCLEMAQSLLCSSQVADLQGRMCFQVRLVSNTA